jgi:hypothetical protein
LYQPVSLYQLWLKVTASGFMPYTFVSTWSWNVLSLPPLIGTMQS